MHSEKPISLNHTRQSSFLSGLSFAFTRCKTNHSIFITLQCFSHADGSLLSYTRCKARFYPSISRLISLSFVFRTHTRKTNPFYILRSLIRTLHRSFLFFERCTVHFCLSHAAKPFCSVFRHIGQSFC